MDADPGNVVLRAARPEPRSRTHTDETRDQAEAQHATNFQGEAPAYVTPNDLSTDSSRDDQETWRKR